MLITEHLWLTNTHLRPSLANLTPILWFSTAVYTLSINVTRWLSYFKLFSNSQEPSSFVLSSIFNFVLHHPDLSSWSLKSSHNKILFPNLMFLFCIQLGILQFSPNFGMGLSGCTEILPIFLVRICPIIHFTNKLHPK